MIYFIILFKKIYILFNIICLYLYLYMTPIFLWFFNNSIEMKNYFFVNFLKKNFRTAEKLGVYNNINFNTLKIKKELNLLIFNHTSLLDNFIGAIIAENSNISWNDVRTISRISRRKIQNTILKSHDMFLVSGNLNIDTHTFNDLWIKWQKSNDAIQIVLFPEGIIYNDITKDKTITKSENYILKNILKIDKFDNLLFPHIGAYNLIINKLKNQIKNVYDISILYQNNEGERIINEEVLLDHLARNDLKINIKIEHHNIEKVIKDPYWLFKIWKKKDEWINSF